MFKKGNLVVCKESSRHRYARTNPDNAGRVIRSGTESMLIKLIDFPEWPAYNVYPADFKLVRIDNDAI